LCRVEAIIKARATHPPITLPEVTDMLKRVYVGAIHGEDYNPAHNAAFSLARLHGLVVYRAQLDVIRRPSREPDAPVELALADWIAALPGPAPGPVISSPIQRESEGSLIIEGSAFGSDLDGARAPARREGEIENGAPTGPVIANACEPGPPIRKRGPRSGGNSRRGPSRSSPAKAPSGPR
jgi:hypothetical protein